MPEPTRTTPHPLLLTPTQAAEAMSISQRTLWSLTKSGVVPAVRIGRSVRYDVADLRAFLAARKTGGAQP